MGSRNGTFINETQLTEPHVVKVGDILRVGRLQFEILVDHMEPGIKKPKVNQISEAAARTALPKHDWNDESITDWLAESPENQNQATAMFDTRQFNLDDTKYRIDTNKESPIAHVQRPTDSTGDVQDSKVENSSGIFGLGKKKSSKKLPSKPQQSSENTTEAAGDVLRRFFNQR
jgi:predicted component of type VI protein secretion system